jgi:hypothetical protein
MKTHLNPIFFLPIALVLFGCATSTPQTQDPAPREQIALTSNVPTPAALPTFADSEIAKLPGVQASMDRCREQNKKHRVTTRVLDSGPMKGNLAIEVTCDE